ncbi:hypothetical protein RD792_006730 [Penstemon davidsonii]|uniref:EF-hand domain-containing protein n=1 Tax=Penstemon davidsonii TaxID=160366 RepID=A0ABR0DBS3_9LAMI|nr:hypothetical protein RD792_006730 [Penstemon davidsonii]
MKPLYIAIFLLLLAPCSISRPLNHELVSDGFDEEKIDSSDFIRFKGILDSKGEERCEQMYGFLPCSEGVFGHLFLIILYEYLLFHGESYVASGGERIFKILGPGVFGASAFQIIGSLPEALILLASGLLSNEEIAQECVLTGVGLLAGSTILLLTVLWGTCVILGAQKFPINTFQYSNPSDKVNQNHLERLLFSLWPERDRDGDKVISFSELKEFLEEIKFRKLQSDTEHTTAEIMKDFDIDNDDKITMDEFVNGMTKWLDLTKDAMNKRYHSVKSLKDLYQVLKPWIQKKREERELMRHLIPEILLHLQKSAYGSLLAEDMTPDIPAIKRLFKEIDLDKDDTISYFELKELMTNMKFGIIPYDVDEAASKIMEELDISGDH